MTIRPNVSYRGYSLQVLHAPPQWQVLIASMLQDVPELSAERRIVRGWNEEDVTKRAKARVDDLIAAFKIKGRSRPWLLPQGPVWYKPPWKTSLGILMPHCSPTRACVAREHSFNAFANGGY